MLAGNGCDPQTADRGATQTAWTNGLGGRIHGAAQLFYRERADVATTCVDEIDDEGFSTELREADGIELRIAKYIVAQLPPDRGFALFERGGLIDRGGRIDRIGPPTSSKEPQ